MIEGNAYRILLGHCCFRELILSVPGQLSWVKRQVLVVVVTSKQVKSQGVETVVDPRENLRVQSLL